MKMYDNKHRPKREITCSYCYAKGHNKRACSHLKAHYLANESWNKYSNTTPIGVSVDMFPESYRNYVSNYTAVEQFRRHFDYAKSVHGKVATSTTSKRKKAKCGFCGKKGHNRRNCKDLRAFVKLLEETNKAYRELFYDLVIDQLGFGIGAFVEVGDVDWNGDITNIRQMLVGRFDLNNVGIGNRFSHWDDYSTTIQVEYVGERCWQQVGGRDGLISPELYRHSQSSIRDKMCIVQDSWGLAVNKVIAPAPTIPPKQWFLGQNPAFDWVVKKKNLSTLFPKYGMLIKNFHPNGAEEYEKWKNKCS